jgi:hypothetical protein
MSLPVWPSDFIRFAVAILPRTTTPLKTGIESYDTRQRLRDRRLGKN